MGIDPETIGTGAGGGGLLAMVFHYFNREKIKDMAQDIAKLKTDSVSVSVCVPCRAASEEMRNELRKDISEIKSDIKMLIQHSLNSRSADG